MLTCEGGAAEILGGRRGAHRNSCSVAEGIQLSAQCPAHVVREGNFHQRSDERVAARIHFSGIVKGERTDLLQ